MQICPLLGAFAPSLRSAQWRRARAPPRTPGGGAVFAHTAATLATLGGDPRYARAGATRRGGLHRLALYRTRRFFLSPCGHGSPFGRYVPLRSTFVSLRFTQAPARGVPHSVRARVRRFAAAGVSPLPSPKGERGARMRRTSRTSPRKRKRPYPKGRVLTDTATAQDPLSASGLAWTVPPGLRRGSHEDMRYTTII